MTGTLAADCTAISAHPPQPLPSGLGGFQWQRGRARSLGVCRFKNATFHNVLQGEGVWAEVMLLNSVSATSFTIQSLNESFSLATAHVTIDARPLSLGNATLRMVDGSVEEDPDARKKN